MTRWRGVILVGVVVVGSILWYVTATPLSTAVTATATTLAASKNLATMAVPPEVVSWSRAEAAGTTAKYDWGEGCDETIGKISLPVANQFECFARFTGDNGGATGPGVTRDSIKVVIYQAASGDGLSGLISAAASGATDPAAGLKASKGYAEILSHYFQTYGRTVEIQPFQGTGGSSDPVAAVADAETIARDITPFMVIGGPLLTNAFADTLAAREIMCWNCTPGQSSAWYERHAPYVWDLQKNPQQGGMMVNEYIGKRLMGRPAIYAGDPAMHTTQRVFGSLHISLDGSSSEISDALAADQKRWGFDYAVDVSFTDPTQLATTGRDLITKLKAAGVTTVVYTGDPIAPATFTRIATEQQYFPEWILTGTALIDINLLPRTFDQQQWAHAFGPANLFVHATSGRVEASDLWTWWFGEPAPIPGAAGSLSLGPMQLLFITLELMGPDVTVEHFRNSLFSAPTLVGSPLLGQISFGHRGLFPGDDYNGVDDQGEVWWDPTAVGVDELGRRGPGVYRWTNNGARVLPGKWTKGQPDVFDPATAVTEFDDSAITVRQYPSLRGHPI